MKKKMVKRKPLGHKCRKKASKKYCLYCGAKMKLSGAKWIKVVKK